MTPGAFNAQHNTKIDTCPVRIYNDTQLDLAVTSKYILMCSQYKLITDFALFLKQWQIESNNITSDYQTYTGIGIMDNGNNAISTKSPGGWWRKDKTRLLVNTLCSTQWCLWLVPGRPSSHQKTVPGIIKKFSSTTDRKWPDRKPADTSSPEKMATESSSISKE